MVTNKKEQVLEVDLLNLRMNYRKYLKKNRNVDAAI